MLGWLISAYPTSISIDSPPPSRPLRAVHPLARWVAGIDGLEWMEKSCPVNGGIFLGGDGYPFLYALPAGMIKPLLLETPNHLSRNGFIPGSVPILGGEGVLDHELLAVLSDHHWVLVEAFDRS